MSCGSSTTAKAAGGVPKAAADGPGGGGGKNEPMTNAEIENRIECSESSRTATFGGVKVRYAFLSQRGYYPDGEWLRSESGSCSSTPLVRLLLLVVVLDIGRIASIPVLLFPPLLTY